VWAQEYEEIVQKCVVHDEYFENIASAYEIWASDYKADTLEQELTCLADFHDLGKRLSGQHGPPTEYEFKDVMCSGACNLYYSRMLDLQRVTECTCEELDAIAFNNNTKYKRYIDMFALPNVKIIHSWCDREPMYFLHRVFSFERSSMKAFWHKYCRCMHEIWCGWEMEAPKSVALSSAAVIPAFAHAAWRAVANDV